MRYARIHLAMKVFSRNITLIINKHQQTQSISNARYAHPFSTIRANLTNIYSLHRQATFKKKCQCGFCKRAFLSKKKLTQHKIIVHCQLPTKTQFRCHQSVRFFLHQNKLKKKHIRYSHSQATSNIYQCEICNISFFAEKARFIITHKHQRSQNLGKTIFS